MKRVTIEVDYRMPDIRVGDVVGTLGTVVKVEDIPQPLKPCPFCGGKAEERVSTRFGYRDSLLVRCLGCDATTQSRAAWNRRT